MYIQLTVIVVLNTLSMANSTPLRRRTGINPSLVPEFGVTAGVNPDGAG